MCRAHMSEGTSSHSADHLYNLFASLKCAFYQFVLLKSSIVFYVVGPNVKLVGCKSALNPSVVYSTDRPKAVVPVLVLLFVALWFIQ